MDFSFTHLYRWLCSFASFFVQACCAGDLSLSLFFFPSLPLSVCLSLGTNDGGHLGSCFSCFRNFGITSKKEMLWVVFWVVLGFHSFSFPLLFCFLLPPSSMPPFISCTLVYLFFLFLFILKSFIYSWKQGLDQVLEGYKTAENTSSAFKKGTF